MNVDTYTIFLGLLLLGLAGYFIAGVLWEMNDRKLVIVGLAGWIMTGILIYMLLK